MAAPVDVARVLRERILDLKYAAGSPLREISIAAEFNGSRRTAREALLRLDREGIVVHERNRGAHVREFSTTDVEDLYKARAALETYGASHCETATDDAKQDLTTALERLAESAVRGQDTLQHAVDDMVFHASVIALADSPKLDAIFSALSVEMTFAIRMLQHDEVSTAVRAEQVVAEHARIHDAVVRGDSRAAVRAVTRHIELNRRRLKRLVTTTTM